MDLLPLRSKAKRNLEVTPLSNMLQHDPTKTPKEYLSTIKSAFEDWKPKIINLMPNPGHRHRPLFD